MESVIRSVCDEVLNDKDANANTRALRATALRLMGEVSSAREGRSGDVAYVRIIGVCFDQEARRGGGEGQGRAAGSAAAC